MLDSATQQQDDQVEIRQLESFVPPPPPPPPPIKLQASEETPSAPSINLLGVGEGPRPKLVSSNHISFPPELSRRGINRVETKVEIIIDQTGRAYVKKIIDPVYPEMIAVIRKSINNSQFTVPRKNGQPVQAVYLYALNFSLRI
ncbi:MAG: hypothetical protein IPK77_14110 [Cellvibrio sp.]|nr:hypothetical protein [Cellvibrio sp.]